MNNYYDENYKALLEKREYNEYISNEQCEDCQVVLSQDLKGNQLLGIQRDERIWYLGSQYDNEYFLNIWVDDFEIESFKSTICIFGLGDYRLIDKLSDKYKENEIIVYEPNASYFKNIMEAFDLTGLIKKNNVELLTGEKGFRVLRDVLGVKVDVTNYKTSIFRVNTQYGILYPTELKVWSERVQNSVDTLLIDKNTYKKYGEERLINNIANYYDCLNSRNVKELLDVIKEKTCDTAIMVAAGPSLDKNIHLLKEAKGKAFIIAVDTAIKPMLNAGVKPDLTVSIDSHKPKELFQINGESVDVPIIVDLQSNTEVIKDYKGKRFYTYNFNKSFFWVYMKPDYMMVNLDSGGSVANDAFSFLLRAGFKNIVLVGQDLAYTGKNTHAGAAYNDEEKIKFEKSDKHFLIEDIYGNQVYTEGNMDVYRKWFERYIEANEKVRFIDATEGGAKIKGTDIMTLRQVIDEIIVDLPEVDFEGIIRSIPDVPEDVLKERKNRFLDIPDAFEKTRKDIIEALRLYDELDDLNRKNKQGSSRFASVSEKIGVINEEIENSIFAAFVSNIMDDTEYDILEGIYEDKSSVYEEVKLVIDSGRKMLNKYQDKFEYIKGLVEKMIEEAGVK